MSRKDEERKPAGMAGYVAKASGLAEAVSDSPDMGGGKMGGEGRSCGWNDEMGGPAGHSAVPLATSTGRGLV